MEVSRYQTYECYLPQKCYVCDTWFYFNEAPGYWVCYNCEHDIEAEELAAKKKKANEFLRRQSQLMNEQLKAYYERPMHAWLNEPIPDYKPQKYLVEKLEILGTRRRKEAVLKHVREPRPKPGIHGRMFRRNKAPTPKGRSKR